MPRRALKVCSHAGCPTLVATGACPEHTRAADRARGTRQQRGYDRQYEIARNAAVATATHCRTCGERFAADNPATGGHVKARRHGGTTADGIKPECRRCNYGWRKTGS